MSFGKNLQYLRSMHGGMTQEKLAEQMGVSRQTISKWEAGEAWPDVPKLLQLCDVMGSTLDELLRTDMTAVSEIYSPVRIETVPAFRMARYLIISPAPEDDVQAYLNAWAQRSGLMAFTGGKPKCIGWDFPFVTPEQQNRFGLRGYAAAYVLPDGFEPSCGGVEIAQQEAATYAIMTVSNPFEAAFERIPKAYKLILEYLGANGFKEQTQSSCLSCFEWVYEKNGVTYIDVHILTDGVAKANLHTGFERT